MGNVILIWLTIFLNIHGQDIQEQNLKKEEIVTGESLFFTNGDQIKIEKNRENKIEIRKSKNKGKEGDKGRENLSNLKKEEGSETKKEDEE